MLIITKKFIKQNHSSEEDCYQSIQKTGPLEPVLVSSNELTFRQGTEVQAILEYGKPRVTMYQS